MADPRYNNGLWTNTAASNRQSKVDQINRVASQLPEANGWQPAYWSTKLNQQVFSLKSGGAYMVYVDDQSPLLEMTGNSTGWLIWDDFRSLREVMAGFKSGMKFMFIANKPMTDITAEVELLAHPPVTVKTMIEDFFSVDPRNVSAKETQRVITKKSCGVVYLQLRKNGSWLLCLAQGSEVKIAKQIGHQSKASVISSKSQTCWQRSLSADFEEIYNQFVKEIETV